MSLIISFREADRCSQAQCAILWRHSPVEIYRRFQRAQATKRVPRVRIHLPPPCSLNCREIRQICCRIARKGRGFAIPLSARTVSYGYNRMNRLRRLMPALRRQLHLSLRQLAATYAACPHNHRARGHLGGALRVPLLRHFTNALRANHDGPVSLAVNLDRNFVPPNHLAVLEPIEEEGYLPSKPVRPRQRLR
jgi:hypothetical protein